MKEGDMLFESSVGKTLDGKWWWRARGLYVVEFCRTYTPEWQDVPDGHFPVVGPYKSERAATRDLDLFEKAYQEFLQTKFPDLEFEDAPDPRSLN